MLYIISGIGLAFAAAIVGVVVRAIRKRTESRARVAAGRETLRRATEDAQRRAELEAHAAADRERQTEAEARRAETEARAAAEREAQRQAEEARQCELEEARVAAEAERTRRFEEEVRAAAEREAQRQADEIRCCEVKEEARAAAERDARCQAEEAARVAAEIDAKRKAEEGERSRLTAEPRRQAEEARAAAEAEARRKAEENEQSRLAAESGGSGQSEADAGACPHAGDERPPVAEEEVQTANGEDSTKERTEPTAQQAPRARAPRYRGPAGGQPAPRQPPSTARTASARTEPPAGHNQALPVELRVLFERGDSLRVSLLPRRSPGLSDKLTVWAPSGTVDLVALQEDWYQDVVPQNLSDLLLEGVLWRDEATGQEWLLSGREIFVLTAGTAHRGLVSYPRLVLGREHAVLCTTTRLPAVESVLREAACEGWTTLDDNDGAPRGWALLRDVLPRRPIPWTDNSDILNALRPLPQVEIALEGGICLGYASWLAEHPPSIRVYGDPDHAGAVQIDGHTATASVDWCYTAPGWDLVGHHQVWCKGASRTYSLVRCEPPSQSWVAFSFPTPGTRGKRIAICGPLVRACTDPQADSEEAATSEIVQVPPRNPVLLGSVPWQVVVAQPRLDIRGAQCIVSPPFAPVWAIPAQPLKCDKREDRVRLIGGLLPPGNGSVDVTARNSRPSIERWCRAILDAGRKGLTVEPADPAVAELWLRYRRYARDLWRRLR
jgi:hypothetical protein